MPENTPDPVLNVCMRRSPETSSLFNNHVRIWPEHLNCVAQYERTYKQQHHPHLTPNPFNNQLHRCVVCGKCTVIV